MAGHGSERLVGFGKVRMNTPRVLMVASLAMFLSVNLGAQESAPGKPAATVRSWTEVVTLPVNVTRHGEHVAGLKKEDFEILQDGQAVKVDSFEEINDSKSRLTVVSPPPGVYTNELEAGTTNSVVVIVLDLINTPYFYQDLTRKRLLKYLLTQYKAQYPTMLVALTPGGLRVLHDFTSDPQDLLRILGSLKGNYEHNVGAEKALSTESGHDIAHEIDLKSEYDALNNEFMGDYSRQEAYQKLVAGGELLTTFYELQQLAHALTAVRGMKSLIWAFGGFTFQPSMDSKSVEVVEEYNRTLNLLSTAGITVHPIDTVLETDNPGYTGPELQSPSKLSMPLVGKVQIIQNFMDISQRTGGDYCLLRKDGELCFQKAVDHIGHYYLLSFYTQHAETATWHRLQVNVHGQDLQVRSRSGYMSAGSSMRTEQRQKEEMIRALTGSTESRDLALTVRWTSMGESAPEALPKHPFLLGLKPGAVTVDPADNNRIRLQVVAVALDANQKILADLNQQIDMHLNQSQLDRLRNTGFSYRNAIQVPKGTSKVRFVVRDDLNERMGSVSAPVQ